MECCFGGFVASSGGTWIDDGSGAVQAKGGSFQVKGKGAGDSPVNARFSKKLSSGEYFEVKLADIRGSAFVGVATEEGFKKGYATKGLFFGGNTSDGNALVKGNFGEFAKSGDIVGVLFESCRILSPVKEETVTVTFYQNGRCLGPAFVSKMANPGAAVYPVVKAGSEGDKYILRTRPAPQQRLREPKKGLSPYEGDWQLMQLMVGPELGEFPLAAKMGRGSVKMTVKATGPETFSLSARVANTLTCNVTSKVSAKYKPFDEFVPTPLMATRMMGSPAMMEVESAVSGALGDVRKWLVRPGKLLLQGPTAELAFDLHEEAIAPDESTPLP